MPCNQIESIQTSNVTCSVHSSWTDLYELTDNCRYRTQWL